MSQITGMSLSEIVTRLERMDEEMRADLEAWRAGKLSELEVQERGVLRQYERRWLEMELKVVGLKVGG